MAARKSWVVFVDNQNKLIQDSAYGGMYHFQEQDSNHLGVFFRESHAIEAAKYLAAQNPGRDVHVFKQSIGFSSQPGPTQQKEWTDEGQYVPVTK